jgi:3-oxoadipate enol-lactonase
MRFEPIGDITHHVGLQGPGYGRTVVFSNSLGTDFRIWDAVVQRLPEDWRILRYDMRGHGLTGAPDGDYAMETLRDDLLGLLDRLSIERASVVGLSVGGMVAQSLAAAAPERVEALVLCDTAPKIATREIWDERIGAVRAGGMAALAPAILERWFGADFETVNPALHSGMNAMLRAIPPQGYAGVCAAIRDADLTESTARIEIPTLCICGTEDISTPPDQVAAMAERMPNARYEAIEGSGHLPCLDAPAKTAALIAEFLGR